MNRYVIIRSDTKSISPPLSEKEAIKKLKEYDMQGITSYLVYSNKYLDFDYINKSNIYEG
ncbi:hypothetical protein CHL78_001740 [Romboutsia weinsteinii]|uniref:Uncharacterized protein n=1 Tax=Romboutsia weinsteinii TaxID=2020949 RepID=A0A371J9M2_9FIRM|nr:hypothetical protein [Romboutsia weinsteinii]RDY29449.1 hypothetical protein CHL78_001740 [Romboutsia weinsteinii]